LKTKETENLGRSSSNIWTCQITNSFIPHKICKIHLLVPKFPFWWPYLSTTGK